MFGFTFFMFLAFSVAGELLRPKPKFDAPKPSSLGDIEVNTAEVGRVITVVFGDCLIKSGNVTWYDDLRVDAITEKVKTGMFSSTRVTKGYRYSLGLQMAVCKGFSAWELGHGSGVVSFMFGDKVVGADTHTSGTTLTSLGLFKKALSSYGVTSSFIGTSDSDKFQRFNIVEPNLFGGDEKEGGVQGTVDCFFGQSKAQRSDYLQAQFKTQNVPAYRGICHLVFRQFYWGTSNYLKQVAIRVRRYPWLWSEPEDGSTPWNINGDANPIALIVEALTNAEWGLGEPLEQIGPSIKAAALACAAEGLGVSMQWDTAGAANELIGDVLRHVDGVLYTDPTTGLYEIALARGGYDTAALPRFDDSCISKLELSRPSWSETINTVKIQYIDRANDFTQNTVERKDIANIQVRNGVISEDSYEFSGFTNSAVAAKVADRVLRTVSYPLAKFKMTVDRNAWSLRPGSVFVLDWPEYGITGMPVRVTRISYGTLTEPDIELDCVEDIFGILATSYSVPPPTGWSDPAKPVAANVAAQLVEAPYHLIGSESRQVMTYAARSSAVTAGYKVLQARNGTADVETEDIPVFTPSAKLSAALSRKAAMTGVTLTVYAGTDLEILANTTAAGLANGANLLQVGGEIMAWSTITDNGDGSYTVGGINRAVLDTVPANHAADTRVWFFTDGVGLTQKDPYAANGSVSAKLVPYTPSGSLNASTVPAISVTLASRAAKPNPPGLIRINSAEFPATTIGDAVLTWAHRNKTTLYTAGQVASQTENSIGSADGSYTVVVYINGVAKRSFTGVTGTVQSYTAAQRAADSTNGQESVVLRIRSVNAASLSSEERITEPFIMTGLGMTLGEYFGGLNS